jgi:hypothetical protein
METYGAAVEEEGTPVVEAAAGQAAGEASSEAASRAHLLTARADAAAAARARAATRAAKLRSHGSSAAPTSTAKADAPATRSCTAALDRLATASTERGDSLSSVALRGLLPLALFVGAAAVSAWYGRAHAGGPHLTLD